MRLKLPRLTALDTAEALRYLKSKPDEGLLKDIGEVWARLEPVLYPAAAAVCLDLTRENGVLCCGGLKLPGRSIAERLSNCRRCIVLGVTLGFEADRLISALGQTDPYRALLTDACATAAVEQLADMATVASRDVFSPGVPITCRFSPGYGDLPLDIQPGLLDLIDARRMLGLTVSQSMLLSPVKSVTAFVGIGEGVCGDNIVRHDCRACFMRTSCQYRT